MMIKFVEKCTLFCLFYVATEQFEGKCEIKKHYIDLKR